MLPLLLTGALLLPLQEKEKEPQKEPPAPAEIARVEAALDQALRAGELPLIQAALEAAQSVPDAGVVRRVLRALEDERREVKLAALQTLRWMEHAEALEALHRLARERKHLKDIVVAAAVLRAIGQHGSPRSVEILARDPFDPEDLHCLRARILGLARIRTVEAVEALVGFLGYPGGGPNSDGRRIHPYMGDVRMGLMLLTGVDHGNSAALWERWWRENKKTLDLPASPPKLPKEMREVWERFWGLPQTYERDRRREDRGQDPEPRKSP